MNVSSFTLFLSLLILVKSFVVCVCLAFEGEKRLAEGRDNCNMYFFIFFL